MDDHGNHAQSTADPGDLTFGAGAAARGDRRRDDRLAQACLAMVLDEIDYGLFLLDARRRVQLANRAALEQLRATPELHLCDAELRPADGRDHAGWTDALNAAYRGLRRLVTLGRDAQRLAVALVPLTPGGAFESARGVLVMLSRPRLCEELSVHGFARDHRLTGAEAKVFAALCRGVDPAKIATDGGVALSTVRSQIASIRAKAQVTSIRQLVQRAAQLPPMVSSLRS